MNKNNKIHKCVIIGSGPAGLTAAIYASRSCIYPILYTGKIVGGQIISSIKVDNYPGFYNGISGISLINNMKKQALKFGAKIIYSSVKKIVPLIKNNIHSIILSNNKIINTYSIIIATGANIKYLNINNEKRLLGKGVSNCATCDGFFFKKKIVAVVGGGDTATENALYLSKLCKTVYIIIRKNKFKSSKIIVNKIYNTNNIKILFNTTVKKILGIDKVNEIIVYNSINNSNNKIVIDGLFVSIGQIPNTNFIKNIINLSNEKFIITNNKKMTNIPGIFAAGDVQDIKYKQIITAASSGCIAAIEMENYLNSKNLL